MSKAEIAQMASEIAALRQRLDAAERASRQDKHTHRWRYSKSISDPESFAGRGTFWSWTCEEADCPQPSSGTNSRVNLPDHFPAELQ